MPVIQSVDRSPTIAISHIIQMYATGIDLDPIVTECMITIATHWPVKFEYNRLTADVRFSWGLSTRFYSLWINLS